MASKFDEGLNPAPDEGVDFEGWWSAWLPEWRRRVARSDSGEEPSVPIEEAWPRIAGMHNIESE